MWHILSLLATPNLCSVTPFYSVTPDFQIFTLPFLLPSQTRTSRLRVMGILILRSNKRCATKRSQAR